MIRLAIPSIDQDDLRVVEEVLASGYLVQGPRVAEFEKTVADYVGTAHAVAVTNCTAALQLALLALDIKAGDKVAVTTYSWPATANVIELCNAVPVFVDIDAKTYNMNPEHLERVLREHTIRAILPVHAFGGFADMPEICALADRAGVPVVEDAACALGTEFSGRRAGAWGVMGCFSFHPRKAITTGEGGVITTNDASVARMLKMLRNHGQDPEAITPDFVIPGYNTRLTEFQAALGSQQMTKVDRIVENRRAGAARYDRLLAGTSIASPEYMMGSVHVYQSYVAMLPPEAAPRRADIIASLKGLGIETTIGTYHMPLIRFFREKYGFRGGDFSVTDQVAQRSISLPLFEDITEDQQALVVSELLKLC